MKRRILLVLFLYASVVAAQVNLASESHYHFLFQNDQVRVFAVILAPGESAYVSYEHNYLVVTPQDSQISMWRDGRFSALSFHVDAGDTRFFFGGHVVGIRNEGKTEYRNITVEFLNPVVGWDASGGAIGPPVDARGSFSNSMTLGSGTVADIQLLAGESLAAPQSGRSELLIPLTEVDLTGSGTEGVHKFPGEVAWLSAGRSALVSRGSEPAHFILVELQSGK